MSTLQLRTLGGLSVLDGATGASAPVQVTRGFRLAALAVLAEAGGRGTTRDRVESLLWPESDAARASASLAQTLYGMRRDLSKADVVLGVGTLRLNPELIDCDLWRFTSALEAGRWGAAADLYAGPFLDGFHLKDSPAFERWVDEVRVRLAASFRDALERAAVSAEQHGDRDAAVAHWRRLAAHDPLDSRVARRLMESLAAVGDTPAALRHARVHEALVRQELDADPDRAVAELATALRAGVATVRLSGPSGAGAASSAAPWRDEPASVPGSISPAASATTGDTPAMASPALNAIPPVRTPFLTGLGLHRLRSLASSPPRRLWPASLAAMLVIGTTIGAATGLRRTPVVVATEHRGSADAAAILPFGASGPGLDFLRDGMVELLSRELQGSPGPRALAPRLTLGDAGSRAATGDSAATQLARSLGARYAIRGSAHGAPEHLVLVATLLRTDDPDSRVEARVEGPLAAIGSLVDRLAAQLLAGSTGEPPDRAGDLAHRSLPALRAYLDGQAAFRSGRLADAVARFRVALESDSTFALAALGLARAGGFTSMGGAWRTDPFLLRAFSLGARLSPRDRTLFEAFVGRGDPVIHTAARRLAAWRRVVELFPDDADAAYGYGDHLFHLGELVGVPDARQQARELFSRASSLDSAFAFPLAHLLELAAADGDERSVAVLAARYARLDSVRAPDASGYVRWRSAVARADERALAELRAGFERLSSRSLQRIVTLSQLDGLPLGDADRAAAILARRSDLPQQRAVSLFVAHTLTLNRGRVAAARAQLASFSALDPGPGLVRHLVDAEVLAITDALFGGGDREAARDAAERLQRERPDRHVADARVRASRYARDCALGLWAIEEARPAAARAVAARQAAAAGDSAVHAHLSDPALCAAMLHAWADVVERRPGAARSVALLDSTMAEGPLSFGSEFGNLLVARLLEQLGDRAGALRAVRRRHYEPVEGAVYLATALRHEARLATLHGDAAGAARAARHLRVLRAP